MFKPATAAVLCGYNCCPLPACQPSCCYTSCRVEKPDLLSHRLRAVCHPESTRQLDGVRDRLREASGNCFRTVYETQYRDQQYTVCKPVCETSSRTRKPTPSNDPVYETEYRECSYTVQRPVWTTEERQCRRILFLIRSSRPSTPGLPHGLDRVVETVNTERCYTVQSPVTTYSTVCRDADIGRPSGSSSGSGRDAVRLRCCGCCQDVPGSVPRLRHLLPRLEPANCHRASSLHDVPLRSGAAETVRCRSAAACRGRSPRRFRCQVCRTVCQEVVEKYQVQCCHYVCEQKVERVLTRFAAVCEQHTRGKSR